MSSPIRQQDASAVVAALIEARAKFTCRPWHQSKSSFEPVYTIQIDECSDTASIKLPTPTRHRESVPGDPSKVAITEHYLAFEPLKSGDKPVLAVRRRTRHVKKPA